MTHGAFGTYVILLYRPYIIQTAKQPELAGEALQECFKAAKDIVGQCHYLVQHHGVTRAPLTWQQ